ncbi:MAG: photosynthetic complex assembly protein PuhC [Longimicrobiales bacterium]|nr:photosynthetic complex assembly protein PuhC [Longimicrobiales bacterium]
MIEINDPLGLEEPRRPIPGWVLAMTAGMAAMALLLTLFSVRTGIGRVSPEHPEDAPLAVLSISFFERRPTGRVDLVAEPGGAIIASLDAGEGGFMRGILRPLRRERIRYGRPLDAPHRPVRHRSGALTPPTPPPTWS